MTEAVDRSRSPAEVRALVRTVLPAWEAASLEGYEDGVNGVYDVAIERGDRRQTYVLKVQTGTDPAAFRPEPYLLDAVARRTDVPVPGVVAVVDEADGDPPFFLMERCAGTRLEECRGDLDPDAWHRVARSAGRHLGEFHLLGSFERFGPLRVRETPSVADGGAERSEGTPRWTRGGRWSGLRSADRPDERGIEEPEFALGVGDAGHGRWADRFRELVATRLGAVTERAPGLAAAVETALSDFDVPEGDPVLAHDHRPGNVLVDPETGAPRAVLDFERAATATARFDLATAVDRLCRDAPLGSDWRRRVRECVLVGYETATGRRPDLTAPVCDAYRLAGRLGDLAREGSASTSAGDDDRVDETVRPLLARLDG